MERMQNMQQRGYGRRYSNPYYNQNTRQNVSMRSGYGNAGNSCGNCGNTASANTASSCGNGCSGSASETANSTYGYNTSTVQDTGCCANNTSCNSCANEAGDTKPFDQFQLAMGYVPWQNFCNTYSLCEALQVGTIFPELDFPFEKARCQRK